MVWRSVAWRVVLWCVFTSGTPPTRVDTTNRPAEAASTMAMQKASVRLALMKMCPWSWGQQQTQTQQQTRRQQQMAATADGNGSSSSRRQEQETVTAKEKKCDATEAAVAEGCQAAATTVPSLYGLSSHNGTVRVSAPGESTLLEGCSWSTSLA